MKSGDTVHRAARSLEGGPVKENDESTEVTLRIITNKQQRRGEPQSTILNKRFNAEESPLTRAQ
ncbi:hypothetical protein EYF80_010533 [Liparis tanakae]|uniref:Uncharacterized protein n=1 Tax=Liparis tanakae TaxID=230148 RepID=A0A4Z2INP3_9TELE|nr:hypothetical protein EYF80_010533 [Liparis tanakae]